MSRNLGEHLALWTIRWAAGLFLGGAVVGAVVVLAVMMATPSQGQERLTSNRPQGYFGVGHEQFHSFYKGLENGAGFSCCNGQDGRPTQARWNTATSTWDVMVDGQWRTLSPLDSYKVLTPEVLAKQGRNRPDNQAHVFTSQNGLIIYCVIPPASGG